MPMSNFAYVRASIYWSLCCFVVMDKETQHRSYCHEVPNTLLTRMESLLWIFVSRWGLCAFYILFLMLRPCDYCLSCVGFRVDMGKPVRSLFSITAGSSWPSSRWRRTTTLKRAWFGHFVFTRINELYSVWLVSMISFGRFWSMSLSRVTVITRRSWQALLKWQQPMDISFSGICAHSPLRYFIFL